MTGRCRRAFVLISVLWFLTGVSALALAAMLSARGGLATSHNRLESIRADWRAEDCVARALVAMDAASIRGRSGDRVGDDSRYPQSLRESALVGGCPGVVTLEPVGLGVDVNRANEVLLRRVLTNQGISAPAADSLVDALLDWRDADDEIRPFGAEREWYASHGEIGPRNAPLADVLELQLVRGFAFWMRTADLGASAVLTTEPGRVLLTAAPTTVVAALPGLDFAGAVALEAHLNNGVTGLPELLALVGVVPPESKASLMAAISELGAVATVRPDAWILKAHASGDQDDPRGPRSVATIALRLVQDGRRFAVVSRRFSP